MKIKLGISGLNTLQLIEKGQYVVGQMTANPNFPTPNPTLASVTAAIDALVSANEYANTGAHQGLEMRQVNYENLYTLLEKLGAYVQFTSGGVGEVITTSGFEVVQPRTPTTVPQKVEQVKAAISGYPKAVALQWKSQGRKADSYVVKFSVMDPTDPAAQWTRLQTCTKASYLAENLPVQNQYAWFRIYAVNGAGAGVASAPVMCMVL